MINTEQKDADTSRLLCAAVSARLRHCICDLLGKGPDVAGFDPHSVQSPSRFERAQHDLGMLVTVAKS